MHDALSRIVLPTMLPKRKRESKKWRDRNVRYRGRLGVEIIGGRK